MKDTERPWTDNVRPASINVNWLRMVTAQLKPPAKPCSHCNGRGSVDRTRCVDCSGTGWEQ